MAKSRVQRNKQLYEEIELGSFEVEDVTQTKKQEVIKEEPIIEKEEPKQEIRQAIVPVKEKKALPVVEKKKVEVVKEEEFVVEQPISYTSKLSIEEILRAKLEKQQKLKDSKKIYKKAPFTKSYTPEDMQRNINQRDGIDIRKEANIKVKRNNNGAITVLVILLILVILAGAFVAYSLL